MTCICHLLLLSWTVILKLLDLGLQVLQSLVGLCFLFLGLFNSLGLGLLHLLLGPLDLLLVVGQFFHLDVLITGLFHCFPSLLLIGTLGFIDLFSDGSNSCSTSFPLDLGIVPLVNSLRKCIQGTSDLGRIGQNRRESLISWFGGRASLQRSLRLVVLLKLCSGATSRSSIDLVDCLNGLNHQLLTLPSFLFRGTLSRSGCLFGFIFFVLKHIGLGKSIVTIQSNIVRIKTNSLSNVGNASCDGCSRVE